MSPSTKSDQSGEAHGMYHAPSSGSNSSHDTAGSISAGISTKVTLSQHAFNAIIGEDSEPLGTMANITEVPPSAMWQEIQVATFSNEPSQLPFRPETNKLTTETSKRSEVPSSHSFMKNANSYSDLERLASAHSADVAKRAEEANSAAEEVDSSSSDPSPICVPSQGQVARTARWGSLSDEQAAPLSAPAYFIPDTAISADEVSGTHDVMLAGIPSTIDVSVESKERPKQSKKKQSSSSSRVTTPNLHPDITLTLPTPIITTSSNSPSPTGSSKGNPSSATLRRGKWTVEEELYVARVIQDFNSGYLNAPAGTTLRSYLSDKLHCDPMRITKKFTGDSCIGKRVFHPAVRCPSNASGIDKAQAELDALERRWRRRLEMQQRESAKKAAVSAAVASAGRTPLHTVHSPVAPNAVPSAYHGTNSLDGQHVTESAVTRTAAWLDRANAILAPSKSIPLDGDQTEAISSLPETEIELQMKAVERLLHEGPIIQQTTAGLPLFLDQDSSPYRPSENMSIGSQDSGSMDPPRDKRARRLSDTGAEDAEALLGFVNTVRAAAAGRNGSE